MPAPSENLRPLSTGQRFTLLHGAILEAMPLYGYSGHVVDYVLAQSALETGDFTSDLLLRANNAFGMRIANQRPQPIIGEDNGYAVYDTLADSVRDYFDRQRAFHVPNAQMSGDYIDATVASGYATATHYADAWTDKLLKLAEADFDYTTAFNLDGVPGEVDPGGPVADGGGSLGTLLLIWIGYKLATS